MKENSKKVLPYLPESLPVKDLDAARLIGLVGKANAALARYDGLLQGIVNPTILLSPLTTQEAVLSSRIEGTQATLDEVLELEAGSAFDESKTRDIQEIVNYREALILAGEVVAERPITLSLVRQIHRTLMKSVRGRDKKPGEFRKEQNWIGPYGCTLEEATYVPPGPLQLTDHLEKWIAYLNTADFDPLVQTAIVHAQFELIHPFMDGNGRIGRLLIPLLLYRKQMLSHPMFYLSAFLEANRNEYYSRLRSVSQDRDWNGWVEFFLRAVHDQALDNTAKAKEMLRLYETMKARITEITHSRFALQVLDTLFDRPIFQTGDFISKTGIAKPTAMTLLSRLRGAGVLKPIRESAGSRPAILAFHELLEIAEGRKIV
jgi:Fic family protein